MTLITLSTSPSLATDTIKIGVIGAHTGDLASYGLPALHAARIVTDNLNAKGGLLGKQIELITQDTACKPDIATSGAAKLISDGVVAVIGGTCSASTKASLRIFTEAKLIAISPTATTGDLTESGTNPYFFRTIAPDSDQSKLAARFVTNTIKAKRVAVLHDNGYYGKGFADYTVETLKAKGIKVILYIDILADELDYTNALNSVQRSKADALIFGGYHPEAVKLVQQMKKRRLNIPFISDDGVKDIAFIRVAGSDSEGVYATGPKDVSSIAMNVEAHEQYRKKYKAKPGAFYANAYAAVVALLTAIEKAGSTDTDKIMEILRTNPVDTPLGTIKFSKTGDAEGIGSSIFQVQKGKYVQIQ